VNLWASAVIFILSPDVSFHSRCHVERSETSGIKIEKRDSSLRYAPFRMTINSVLADFIEGEFVGVGVDFYFIAVGEPAG